MKRSVVLRWSVVALAWLGMVPAHAHPERVADPERVERRERPAFEQRKARIAENLRARAMRAQAVSGCVDAAADEPAVRACRERAREAAELQGRPRHGAQTRQVAP